ncbi:MAG TPA: bifunctional NADP-dependent methylenetetrahydromethanopterin dehydrogenase/methylenetetrahydrofolate dehydrogenase [Planctomycetaceae bacterium]|nr:bifunctional NADP-dependent methylenetetrahydromethanopterin dehydrogenase/methylenetetrahydrofolate dehydrogenase [Planctomycetaceae bacterium]
MSLSHPRILLQFDSDEHASVFDAVVAVDSGVEHLLQYASVEPVDVEGLVHGAMFTRGPDQLKNTAIFVGGSDVGHGERIAECIKETFFGPVKVSVMLDSNGSNTTAAAAVLCARRHLELSQAKALVPGGTGPVGRRVARLLLAQGAQVVITSRDARRAQSACSEILANVPDQYHQHLSAMGVAGETELRSALDGCNLLVSCGAAGAQLVSGSALQASELKVAIDLNAVAPAGIEGISVMDKAVKRGDRIDYGAIGTGGLKMKIHRESIRTLFTSNDLFLDAEQIFAIGLNLEEATELS